MSSNAPSKTGVEESIFVNWMNVSPADRDYPNAPSSFEGGWETDPDSEPASKAVRVWLGIEDGETYSLTPTLHDEAPKGANYLVETVINGETEHERFAETQYEALTIAEMEKDRLQPLPDPTFSDKHRNAIRSALEYYGGVDETAKDPITLDTFSLEQSTTGDYHYQFNALARFSGTLDLDEVLDSQGPLLGISDYIDVNLAGFKDGALLLRLTDGKQVWS